MKWQVCSTDRYNNTSIIRTVNTVEEAINEAKKQVSDDNFNNPLTFDEQKKSWESFTVETGNDKVVFTGKDSKGHFCFAAATDPKKSFDISKLNITLYLGERATGVAKKSIILAEDARGKTVDNLDPKHINNKTVYFVKPII